MVSAYRGSSWLFAAVVALVAGCGAQEGATSAAQPSSTRGPNSSRGADGAIGGPTLFVTNGLYENTPAYQPLLFTWRTRVRFYGEMWAPNEAVTIHLYGPINTLGVTPTDRILGQVFTNAEGQIAAGIDYDPVLELPYEVGGAAAQEVLRPGLYLVRVPLDRLLGRYANALPINIVPRTTPIHIPGTLDIDWPRSRGGRDGFLGDHSPERTDPEWTSVWSEAPIEFYGTVTSTGPDGANQPSIVSHEDFMSWHYAHDADLFVTPDPEYRWTLSDVSFLGELDDHEFGRLEIEWETLNGGRGTWESYGTGDIGLPLWAMPTVGDRVYAVGRWVLDNGHPPAHTEIHPPRLFASMRKRPAPVPAGPRCGAPSAPMRSAQLDVYVSGHGGGSNQFYDGLSAALDAGGRGGGRLEDVLSSSDFATYEASGPAQPDLLTSLALWATGFDPALLQSVAGPSAFGWIGHSAQELRPISDMNYDFDMPLPPPPLGATGIGVEITTHPEHTTSVQEVLSYVDPDPATGLPTRVHVHLPYLGADEGIYARTLRFSWNVYQPPGRHFVVRLDRIDFFQPSYMTGHEYLWADVSGQWRFLTSLDPARFDHAPQNATIALPPGTSWDVFLEPDDVLRVFVQGYDRGPFDDLMGVSAAGVNQTSRPAYDVAEDLAGIALPLAISINPPPGFGDSEDLLGSVFEGAPIPTIPAAGGIRGSHASVGGFFTTYLDVAYVPSPHVQVAPVDFGAVCVGSSADRTLRIANTSVGLAGGDPYANAGVDTLDVNLLLPTSVSLLPPLTVTSFGVDAAQHQDLNIRFSPTAANALPGALVVGSNDACWPTLTLPFTATVLSPSAALSGTLEFGALAVDDRARRHARTLPFTIGNSGACALVVRGVSVVAGDRADFRIHPPLTFPVTIPPGGSLTVPVEFNPTHRGHRSATLSVEVANDPAHLTPLTIVASGYGRRGHGHGHGQGHEFEEEDESRQESRSDDDDRVPRQGRTRR
jgi:hypothetical protein